MSGSLYEAIDYKYLLIEYYKKFSLNEVEAMSVLVIANLLDQGNKFITADLLALKMSLPVNEIDKVLVSLLSKNIIEYENTTNEMRTTLKPLKEKLKREFELDILKRREDESTQEYNESIKKIMDEFVKALNRDLSPLEKDKIHEWLSFGYQVDFILDALKEAISEGKKTIRSVDKILMQKVTRNDMEKEGYSAINNVWKKDIDETINIATKKWNEK